MTQYVGYIGTTTVTVVEEIWDEDVLILGEDPAHEAPEDEFEVHSRASFVGAWRRAVKMIRDRGGVVVNRPPCKPRVKHLTRKDRYPGWDGDTGVRTCPWGTTMEFRSRREAKKYAKRNRASINDAWDY